MQTPQLTKFGPRAWLPIIGLAFAAFVFNTSEFLPVGLLPDIAHSLNETVPFTGLILTGYAFVVAVMSLPLTVLTAKVERRKLLLVLLIIFSLCHFVVLWVQSFEALLAARVGVALAHSVFWSIMTPLAARVAPHGRRALGLACVMGGTIVATVLGVPIGTKLGHYFGWQEAFCIIGLASMTVFCIIFLTLPECRSSKAGSFSSLPIILRRPALLQLYALTVITVLGQYTVYSYISPIMSEAGGFSEGDIVTMLFVFGIAGIAGTVIGSKTVERFKNASLAAPLTVIAACLFLLVPACANYSCLAALIFVWGAAITVVCLAFQTLLLSAASDAADVATSLYSGIFNVGIGGGAFIGSRVSEHFGFLPVSFVGAALVCVSLSIVAVIWIKTGSAVLKSGLEKADEEGAPLSQ